MYSSSGTWIYVTRADEYTIICTTALVKPFTDKMWKLKSEPGRIFWKGLSDRSDPLVTGLLNINNAMR